MNPPEYGGHDGTDRPSDYEDVDRLPVAVILPNGTECFQHASQKEERDREMNRRRVKSAQNVHKPAAGFERPLGRGGAGLAARQIRLAVLYNRICLLCGFGNLPGFSVTVGPVSADSNGGDCEE